MAAHSSVLVWRIPGTGEPGRLPSMGSHRVGHNWSDLAAVAVGSLKKQESSRKPSTSALLTMPKPLTVWITINYGKFWKRWEYQTTWCASWEICMQVRKEQLELDMEQQELFKIGKGVHQGCLLLPCLFNLYAEYIMQNAGLDEAQAGINLPGQVSITSGMQMAPPLWQKVKKN